MSTIEFNFTSLSTLYDESLYRNEPTLAFEIVNGNGKFVFMMFFENDDNQFENILFIFCRNIKYMIKLKLYGNQEKGKFSIYLNEDLQNKIIEELQLYNRSGDKFDFNIFLENLNSSIPSNLSFKEKAFILKKTWKFLDDSTRKNLVDDSEKIYLKGVLSLPSNKKPQERTLRKLYLYVDGIPDDISDFLNNLRNLNKTLQWTDDKSSEKDFSFVLSKL